MQRKRPDRRRVGIIGATLLLIAAAAFAFKSRPTEDIAPLPESRVLQSAHHEGSLYKLVDDGRVYRVQEGGNRWTYVDTVFDPEEIKRTYTRERGITYRIAPDSGKRYPVQETFQADFEEVPTGVDGLRQLIGEKHKWTEVTLQSPKAPTIPAYVDLRNRILGGSADFLDDRVEPSSEQSHGGKQSLKCVCPPKSSGMVCSKASLSTGIVYYTGGQDIWYRAWYRIEGKTRPLTLVDLEDSLVKESPGIRVMLFDEGELGAELKSLGKPTFRQNPAKRKLFPLNRWVEVIWQVHLDAGQEGKVRLWQDGELVVDASGPTLPFRTAIYNSLEVGISAHASLEQPATLFVDDLLITTLPIRSTHSRFIR